MSDDLAIIDILRAELADESSIPPMNNNSVRLQKEIAKESPNLKQIENLIKADAALTLQVLKIANSPMYKGLEQVDTIKEAMLRLGFDEIKNIVVWAIHQSSFQTDDPFIRDYKKRLFFHSLSCASGAVWAARYLDMEEVRPRAFIAGLLHDIGSIYLLTALEKVKKKNQIKKYPSDFVLEKLIHTYHTDEGYTLLKAWNLPDSLAVIARDHKAESFDTANHLLCLIRLVNQICVKMEKGNPPEETAAVISSSEAAILGVSELGIAEIEIGIEGAQEKFKALF